MDSYSAKIAELVNLYSRRLIAYSRLICGDTEIARDAVADTFYKLCTLKNIDDNKISAWLYRTCRNRTIDILRREKFCFGFDESYISTLADESKDIANRDIIQTEHLLKLISQLPKQQSEILMLRYFSELKYAEIADVLGISTNLVGVSISRALESLKKDMGENIDE